MIPYPKIAPRVGLFTFPLLNKKGNTKYINKYLFSNFETLSSAHLWPNFYCPKNIYATYNVDFDLAFSAFAHFAVILAIIYCFFLHSSSIPHRRYHSNNLLLRRFFWQQCGSIQKAKAAGGEQNQKDGTQKGRRGKIAAAKKTVVVVDSARVGHEELMNI
jgi:hypothetical protein